MKQKIAVLFGGCSPEYTVSLQSAQAVLEHMDPDRFLPVPIAISREGDWFLYEGPVSAIGDDHWQDHPHTPAILSPSRSTHGLLVLRPNLVETIYIDAALPILHGENGEDGTVQGLVELSGIPLAGCGSLASALCMDKGRAHQLAELAGVTVPRGQVILAGETPDPSIGFPCFVKPLRAGSSFGISRVETAEELPAALSLAAEYGREIIVEEAIPGPEVGTAVMGIDELLVGEPDMIQLSGGFFNFTEKYNLITSDILVPAPIPPEKTAELKEAAKKVYRALACRGFARIDFFLTPDGQIVFNEANTIPGFTAHSRFPNMMKAAGVSFTEVITKAIDLALL